MAIVELYRNASEIPLETWRSRGVKIPVFDIDGTLTAFHEPRLLQGIVAGLKRRRISEIFPRIALASNGNSIGSVDSIGDLLAEDLDLEEVYGVCTDQHRRKPYPDMGVDIANHFDVEVDELGMIGDRWATDVRFGQSVGMRVIALCSKVGSGDAAFVPLLRVLETGLVVTVKATGTIDSYR